MRTAQIIGATTKCATILVAVLVLSVLGLVPTTAFAAGGGRTATAVTATSKGAAVAPLSGIAGQRGAILLDVAANVSNVVLFNTWTGMCADLPGYGTDPINTPVNQYYCNDTSSDNQL